MMKCILAVGAFALAATLHAAEPPSVDAALARAKQAHSPLLLDFSAPWCYSCYFMATHVLNGAEWDAIEARTIVATVDADSPDGAAWMKKLEIKALPAYVVLNEDGAELGRILAEQPRAKFYPMVERILAGASTLDALKRKAFGGSPDALAGVLGAYQARDAGKDGLAWYATLPAAVRGSADKDATVALWRDRLALAQARAAKDDKAAVAAAQRVLDGDIGCDRPYVVDNLLEASEKLPKPKRAALLKPQRARLEAMLARDIYVDRPACADQRSTVVATADVDAALDDAAAEKAVLDRAIADARTRLGDDYAKDRNLADNLRVYLVRAKRDAELYSLYPKLIAAYPDDYVYSYRYGRSLLEHERAADALPWLEKAAGKAYGENRLTVATYRVKALKALKRKDDAAAVVAEVLEQNGQWFPEQVAALKAALKS
jgi:thiol-disulfide isomerase/thioredoxin